MAFTFAVPTREHWVMSVVANVLIIASLTSTSGRASGRKLLAVVAVTHITSLVVLDATLNTGIAVHFLPIRVCVCVCVCVCACRR
jgi:hypothetical protein